MKQILELFLMIFMGYVIVKTGLLKDEDSKVISKIVLYLIIPCVIINAFQVEYTDDKVKGLFLALVASVLLQVLLLLIVWAIGRVWLCAFSLCLSGRTVKACLGKKKKQTGKRLC